MVQRLDPGTLASDLNGRLKDKVCVVKLKRGADHLGMARMEVEKIFADDESADSKVLRVVGRQLRGSDHAMLGLPLTDGGAVSAYRDGDDVTLRAGEFEMAIQVDKTGLDE